MTNTTPSITPRPRDLLRWQTTHLCDAIWRAEQKDTWDNLAPVIQLNRHAGYYDARSGTYDYRKPALPKTATAQFLSVDVPALPECGIPAHTVELYRSDYDAVLADLSEAHFDAWLDYIDKPRRSAIFAHKKVTRKRVADDAVVSTRIAHSVQRNTSASEVLERAAILVARAASLKTVSALKEGGGLEPSLLDVA